MFHSDHGIVPVLCGVDGYAGGHRSVPGRRLGGEVAWSTKGRFQTICWICHCGLGKWPESLLLLRGSRQNTRQETFNPLA